MAKKKSKINNISDRLGKLTKNSELQKAKDILEKQRLLTEL